LAALEIQEGLSYRQHQFSGVLKHSEYEKLFTACNEKQIWVERCLGEFRLG